MKRALVVAAHPDDEVLGCGGTIAKLAMNGFSVDVIIMAEGETSRSSFEQSSAEESLAALRKAATEAGALLGAASVVLLGLPDNRMDSMDLLDVVKRLEATVGDTCYNAVYTHHSGDVNIDHQIVNRAVVTVFRPMPGKHNPSIYAFEVPSSTEWQPPSQSFPFLPTVFVDVSAVLERKIAALKVYESEMRPWPHARSLAAVEALAKWRGATVGVDAAEAFVACRIIE
ncbi:PIG-L deacetylase family protein [Desulfovibrio subterraneus]|uniref:LmbE family protein n=1 Tax=Desulfovibrio subterraneus TaxID=2718620 RepID=A0A7J0BPL7_9BACT|nr:PIG-L family deacetylase [Desulfovibrio subterraneus]GFM35152.1 LmbE family protein [Desulfovibrio subterraneus]